MVNANSIGTLKFLTVSLLTFAVLLVCACDVVPPPPGASEASPTPQPVSADTEAPDAVVSETIEGFDVKRLRPGEDADGVLVLLHGYGSSPDSIVEVGRRLRISWDVVAPRGPRAVASDRHSWYPLSFDSTGGVGQPESVDEAMGEDTAGLVRLVESLKIEGKPLVVGGFSQGAMVALHLASVGAEGLDGVVVLSGDWPAGTSRVDRSLSYFVAHGEADPLIPIDRSKRLQARLGSEATTYKTYRGMRHTVGARTVADLAKWLEALD